jgi:hypothetical protein
MYILDFPYTRQFVPKQSVIAHSDPIMALEKTAVAQNQTGPNKIGRICRAPAFDSRAQTHKKAFLVTARRHFVFERQNLSSSVSEFLRR